MEITAQLQAMGKPVSQTVNIEDTPEQLRHACCPMGVTFLPQQVFNVPTEDMGCLPLNFYYCPYCGKLYVYRFLYD